jgi:opacity protein-like surface antigen
MKKRLLFLVSTFSLSILVHAQWEVEIGAGAAIPITGYNEVLKSGWLLSGKGHYRLGKGNFAIGANMHFTRLQQDGNSNDTFQNARMTIAPLLFTAEYSFNVKGKIQPYVTGGLGISFFNLNYDISSTEGRTVSNVSFTMMPLFGLRYQASTRIHPFIESGFVLIADGPPVGFPKGEKLTGYNSINAGIHYKFKN